MKKSEETKDKILDTVVGMFKTNDNITIKDICAKAYINIAAVNYHFGDKETLIALAIQKTISSLKKQVEDIARHPFATVEDALYVFVDLVYNFSLEYPGVVKYMLTSDQNSQGNGILQEMFNDKHFTQFIFNKIQETTGEGDFMKSICKYIIMLSAFVFPMMCKYAMGDDEVINFVSLNNEEFKKNYIHQLLKIVND